VHCTGVLQYCKELYNADGVMREKERKKRRAVGSVFTHTVSQRNFTVETLASFCSRINNNKDFDECKTS
jgi:hypothetical protein